MTFAPFLLHFHDAELNRIAHPGPGEKGAGALWSQRLRGETELVD